MIGYAPILLNAAGRQLLFATLLAVIVGLVALLLRRRSPLLHLMLWSLVLWS